MPTSVFGSSLFLLLATLAVAYLAAPASAQSPPPLCRYCNGSQIRCRIGQQCCNFGMLNAQCVSNTLTCNAPIACSSPQEFCGTACNTLDVWCPVGQVCCNKCQGANTCVAPGGACTPDCPGC